MKWKTDERDKSNSEVRTVTVDGITKEPEVI